MSRLLGVAVGFVGVALLVGAQPEGKMLGALAVVGMAFCYGVGGLLSGRYLQRGAAARGLVRLDRDRDARLAPGRRRRGAEPAAELEDDRLAWSPSACPGPRSPTCSSSA